MVITFVERYPGIKYHQCPLCDLSFTQGDTLTGHVKKWHRVESDRIGILRLDSGVALDVTFRQPYIWLSEE